MPTSHATRLTIRIVPVSWLVQATASESKVLMTRHHVAETTAAMNPPVADRDVHACGGGAINATITAIMSKKTRPITKTSASRPANPPTAGWWAACPMNPKPKRAGSDAAEQTRQGSARNVHTGTVHSRPRAPASGIRPITETMPYTEEISVRLSGIVCVLLLLGSTPIGVGERSCANERQEVLTWQNEQVEQLAANRLTIPQDAIARLLQRLVRHFC